MKSRINLDLQRVCALLPRQAIRCVRPQARERLTDNTLEACNRNYSCFRFIPRKMDSILNYLFIFTQEKMFMARCFVIVGDKRELIKRGKNDRGNNFARRWEIVKAIRLVNNLPPGTQHAISQGSKQLGHVTFKRSLYEDAGDRIKVKLILETERRFKTASLNISQQQSRLRMTARTLLIKLALFSYFFYIFFFYIRFICHSLLFAAPQ